MSEEVNLSSTNEKIGNAKRELLLAREDLNRAKLYKLAGELSAVVIVLDELERYLLTKEGEA